MAVPFVMDGVNISAETCAEKVDPFGMGDLTRATYLSYAASACCSAAGHVCSKFTAQICADPSDWSMDNSECLNWQAVLGAPDIKGDTVAWCTEKVLGPSVSCQKVEGNCLMMARSIVTAFASGNCCGGGAEICQDLIPISTCDGAQSVWYGLRGSCPEECNGEGADEVCTRSSDTCGTAGCDAYLKKFTVEYTEKLVSGMLECDPKTGLYEIYNLASGGVEHVQADVMDIGQQCGFTTTTSTTTTSNLGTSSKAPSEANTASTTATFGPVVMALVAAPPLVAVV